MFRLSLIVRKVPSLVGRPMRSHPGSYMGEMSFQQVMNGKVQVN